MPVGVCPVVEPHRPLDLFGGTDRLLDKMHVLVAPACGLRVVERERTYPGGDGQSVCMGLRVPRVVGYGENASDLSTEIGSAGDAKWNRGQLDSRAGPRGVVKSCFVVARAPRDIVQWPVAGWTSVERCRF